MDGLEKYYVESIRMPENKRFYLKRPVMICLANPTGGEDSWFGFIDGEIHSQNEARRDVLGGIWHRLANRAARDPSMVSRIEDDASDSADFMTLMSVEEVESEE